MKKHCILITAFLCLTGFSSVHAIGPKGSSFKPSYCSELSANGGLSIALLAVKQVCLGKIAGALSNLSSESVQLSINDGTVRTYSIETMTHAGPGGFSGSPATTTFFGKTLPGVQPADHVSGTYRTSGTSTISINLSAGANFKFQGTLVKVN